MNVGVTLFFFAGDFSGPDFSWTFVHCGDVMIRRVHLGGFAMANQMATDIERFERWPCVVFPLCHSTSTIRECSACRLARHCDQLLLHIPA